MPFNPKKRFRSDLPEFETEELGAKVSSAQVPKRPLGKLMRKVSPLGMRVLLRIRREANVTDGGLYLPEGAKQSMAESFLAEVIEVASAADEHGDEETNISGVPLGAMVLIPKHAGVKVPWDEDLRLVETKEVLAIVNEIEIV